jgi:NADH-quinone oxidoreductase subunit J
MYLDIAILILMVVCALWAVMAADLLKSAIGLAVTSAILAVIMFRLTAPLAAVFELSVCAGLITVVFISIISLTRPGVEKSGNAKKRFGRYILLPLVVLIAGIALFMIKYQPDLSSLLPQSPETDMRRVLWGQRQLDLFGQVVVLLAGIFGVVVLFKERGKSE